MKRTFSNLCLRLVITAVVCTSVTPVGAQADRLSFNAETATLHYEISYERGQAVAEALGCPQTVLENGLLHSALRHIFLFLPLEASYHEAAPGVETLEVQVVRGSEETLPVFSLQAPLAGIRATNDAFRVYMNSFASPKAGFCFAVDEETLAIWLATFLARGGQFSYDSSLIETDFEGAADSSQAAQAVPVDSNAETVSEVPSPEALAEAVPDVTPEATPVTPEPGANEFQLVPYLTDMPVREFAAPQEVLEPETDYAAIIETSKGVIALDLFESLAPRMTNNFIFLARNRFFEGVPFHRVLEDFVAQTGDPTGTGLGGPGYETADEIASGLSHSAPGVVSMANAGPNMNGSQFFITFAPAEYLDGQFSIFGVVTEGLGVLERLQRTDPAAPLAVATLDTSLGLLTLQGVTLEGDDEATLDTYLLSTLGAVPGLGQRISLGEYDIALGMDPQTGAEVVSVWPAADRIVSVQILAKPK